MLTSFCLYQVMKEALKQLPDIKKRDVFESVFLFCVIWSMGAVIDSPSRVKFDDYLR